MNKKFIFVLKIFFTALLLTFIFIKVPLGNILKTILEGNIILIFIAFAIILPVIFLSSLQTVYLTKAQKLKLSLRQIIKVYVTSSFYSLFLPGTLSGGGVKWYKFSKYGSKTSAAAIVVYNRFLEIFILSFIGLVFFLPTLLKSFRIDCFLIWLLCFSILVSIYFFSLNSKVLKKTENISNKILYFTFIKVRLEKLFESIKKFQSLSVKEHMIILIIMFFYQFLNVVSFYLLAKAINISIDLLVLGWMRSLVAIVTILPISISGFGIREVTYVYLFKLYDLSAASAVAISLLMFSRSLVISLLGGFWELKDFLFIKKNKKIEEIKI